MKKLIFISIFFIVSCMQTYKPEKYSIEQFSQSNRVGGGSFSDDETETINENKSKTWHHDYKDMNIRNNVPLVQLAYSDLEYNLRNKENDENNEINENNKNNEINENKEINENNEIKEINETKEINENNENKEKISFQKEISSTPINKIIENEVKNDNVSDTSSNTSSTNLSNEYTNINYDDIKDIM